MRLELGFHALCTVFHSPIFGIATLYFVIRHFFTVIYCTVNLYYLDCLTNARCGSHLYNAELFLYKPWKLKSTKMS